jgi:lipoate-protein ligase B
MSGSESGHESLLAAVRARHAPGTAGLPAPVVRHLGLVDYQPTWRAMQRFTEERSAATADEIWFLEHPPVFTLGLNAAVRTCSHPATFRWCRSIAAGR